MTHAHSPTAASTPDSHDEHPADEPHGARDHGNDGGHGDDANVEQPLGPIDWATWTVGIVSAAIGVLIALGFAISTGYLGA